MLNKIRVSETRRMFPQRMNLGTIGERNATELVFVLPVSLQGYSTELVCVTSKGSFKYLLENGHFFMPQEILTDSTLDIQLVLKNGNSVIWKSVPCTFTLNPTIDDSGIHESEASSALLEAEINTLWAFYKDYYAEITIPPSPGGEIEIPSDG